MLDIKPKQPAAINALLNISAALLTVVIGVVIMRQLSSFLQPFFIAVFFFYISEPIMTLIRKKKMPSFLAYLVPLLLVLIIFLVIGWIVGAHVDNLAAKFPSYKGRIQDLFQSSLNWTFENLPVVGERLRSVFSGQTIPLKPLETLVRTIVSNFFGFLSFGLLVVFFLIFIMQEAATLPQRLEAGYGAVRAKQILEVGDRINKAIIRYVYVKGCASLLVAFFSTVAMLSFRLDLALFWGAVTFFGNFVPYVGSAFAVVCPILIAMLQFSHWGAVVALLIILVSFQVLVGNYLEPKFAGYELNLSPLIVLLSLAFWAWLWGIVGLILAIPVMVSIKFILENIPATHSFAALMSHVSKKT